MTDRRMRASWLALALLSTAPMTGLAQDSELSLPGADTAEGSPEAPPLAPDARPAAGDAGAERGGAGKVRVFLRSRRTAPVRYSGGSLGFLGARRAKGSPVEGIRNSVRGAVLLEKAAMEALADPAHGAEDAVQLLIEASLVPMGVSFGEATSLDQALTPAADAGDKAHDRAQDFRKGLVQALEEILADPLAGGLAQAAFDPVMASRLERWRLLVPQRMGRFRLLRGTAGRVGPAEAQAYTGVLAVLEVATAAAHQSQRDGWALPVRQVGTSSVLDAAGVAHEAAVGRYADLVLGSPERIFPARLAWIPPLTPSTGMTLMGLFLLAIWGGAAFLVMQVGRAPPAPVEVEDPRKAKAAMAKAEGSAKPDPQPSDEPEASATEEVPEDARAEPTPEAEADDSDKSGEDDSSDDDSSEEPDKSDEDESSDDDSDESEADDSSSDDDEQSGDDEKKEVEKKAE